LTKRDFCGINLPDSGMVYYCKCFPAKFYTPILKEISSKNTMIYLVKQKIIGTIEYIVEYNVVKIGINNTAAGIINLNF
jgi:hypothetical protein